MPFRYFFDERPTPSEIAALNLGGNSLSKNSELPDAKINNWPKSSSNRRISLNFSANFLNWREIQTYNTGMSFSTCHSMLDTKWWNSCRSRWCAKPWKKSTEPNKYMMELDTLPNCFPMLTWWWSSSVPSKAMAMLSCGFSTDWPEVYGLPKELNFCDQHCKYSTW